MIIKSYIVSLEVFMTPVYHFSFPLCIIVLSRCLWYKGGMKPWENVKRQRERRKIYLYSALVIGGFIAIIALSNNPVSAPVKSAAPDTPATRNAKRITDLKDLRAALTTYQASHKSLPYALPTTPTQICSVATPACKKTKLIDLNYLVSTDTGLASLPTDPVGGPGYGGNGYTIMMGSDSKIEFAAPRAESGTTITLKQ